MRISNMVWRLSRPRRKRQWKNNRSVGSPPLSLAESLGWLAEQFMKSQMGLAMNIVIGIIGAAVASWLFGLLGITFAGWIGYLIAGFIGACILIAIVRAFSGGLQQRT